MVSQVFLELFILIMQVTCGGKYIKMPNDNAPVEFIIKVDGKQVSSYKTMLRNSGEIEKKLRELMKLIHPNLGCNFCAELVPDGENLEITGFGEWMKK